MKVWELDGKANDVTRSKTLTISATFHKSNARVTKLKVSRNFVPVLDADTLLILQN
jgi:hypothetical protein